MTCVTLFGALKSSESANQWSLRNSWAAKRTTPIKRHIFLLSVVAVIAVFALFAVNFYSHAHAFAVED